MTANAFRPTAPLGIAVFMLSSATVCSIVLLGGAALVPRVGVFLGIIGISVVCVWRLSRAESLTLKRVDQAAWAILICHPVLLARVRDRSLAVEGKVSIEIAIEMTIWCILIMYAVGRLLRHLHRLRSLWGRAGRYATLFLAAAAASAFYSASPMITLAWSVKLLTILSLSCVLFDSLDPRGSCRRFLGATFWGLVLMLVEFLALAALSPDSALIRSEVTGIWRVGGFLLHPNQLSSIAGIVALLTLVDILSGTFRRYAFAVFSMSCALMLVSLGRGGILATVIAMIFSLAAFRRIRIALCLGCAAALILVAVPDTLDLAWQILSRRQTGQEIMSLTGRVELWQTAIELIVERPFLGWGYVSGGRVALLTVFRWWPAAHSHNAYLETLLGLGVVGGIIVFLLLWRTYGRLIGFLRAKWTSGHPDSDCVDCLKVLSSMVSLAIGGLFESNFGGAPHWATILLIGSAFYSDHLRYRGTEQDHGKCA